MARWQWVLLISELFLFALILVLPQVDLPDTTFREGGAPVAVRTQLNSPPSALSSAIGPPVRVLDISRSTLLKAVPRASLLSAFERCLLVCALLC